MKISFHGVSIFLVFFLSLSVFAAFPVGDLDRDFIVDMDDLVLFVQQWMQYPDCFNTPGCGDLEGNDDVNLEDFALLVQNWQLYATIPLAINELMASNDTTLQDPDEPGEYPDWIEIYNYGDETIPLSGMVLEDSANTYLIPSGVDIDAGQYLVFYADEEPGQGPLHTNFKLGASGDEVTLLAYDGVTIVDTISFSGQSTDISYGRYEDATDNWYTMDSPSPGLTNNVGRAGEVYFSRLSGTFTSNFNLELSTTTPGATIRYTTDGSIPTASSTIYSSPTVTATPINISTSGASRIRARVYHSTLAPGPVTSHYYTPLASDVQNFSSNLPIVIIETHGAGMDWGEFNTAYSTVLIDLDRDTGLASMQDIPDYAGRSGLHVRGESSAVWPKKQYALELWDENNTDTRASLLGMPSESDWILNAPYGDKTLMRNVLAFKWANDIEDEYAAPRTQFVEVFLNDDGGNCSYTDYNGVYVLMEKIKVSDDRVNIAKLSPTDTTSPDITGGYIVRVDKNYSSEFEDFTTSANMVNNPIQYFDPDQDVLVFDQKQYIQSFFNQFETDLNGSEFNDPNAGYAQHIDIESFIEFDIIAEIFKNVDGFKLSTYFHKERDGKLSFGPQWDYNFSAGNGTNSGWGFPAYFSKASSSEGWFNQTMPVYGWHSRMMADADYTLRTADKWYEHREDKLSDAQMAADIDYYYNLLDADGPADTDSTPADRNFAKWDILNTWVECNYYIGATYQNEINWLKTWFYGNGSAQGDYSDRMQWVDDLWKNNRNIDAPPTLLIDGTPMNTGGTITAGATLTMTGPSGTVYYTTDGTDPREWTYRDVGEPDPGVDPFTRTLVAESASKAVLVPSGPVSDNWKGGGLFDDSSWNTYSWISGKSGGVGYENGSSYDPYISYDVVSLMYDDGGQGPFNTTCYIRTPFTVSSVDLPDIDTLKLRVRFDDAFVAYINGTEVARSAFAPGTLTYNSAATNYTEPESTSLIEFDITAYISELVAGSGNILAVHGMNNVTSSSDLLISFELEANSAGVPGSGGGELIAGGAVSANAIAYSGGITLNDSTRIKARVKNGSDWTALNEAYFSDDWVVNSLRVTEIMYHPADPNHEFIEVQNIGPSSINLAWAKFTDGIDFTFPSLSLGAGQYAVVVRNQAMFEVLHGTGMTIAGQFTGALNNAGEEIVLKDASGAEILDFDYNDNWYPVTDGAGFSLNIINSSDPDPNSWDDKEAWQAGSIANGSPGSANPANIAANGAIVINEVLTHSNAYPNDWIELYNTTGSTINIGGWFLSDDRSNLKKYQIAAGQSILPGGYKVFTQDDNFGDLATDPGRLVGFGLSELGEEVYLSSGSGGNLAGGYSVWEEFGASEWDVSFGRHVKSATADYDVDFVSMQSMTSEAANSGPLVEGVVITEIMYNASLIQDQLGEYIELKNRTGSAIGLFDAVNPSNTWKFTKGIDFTFPTSVSIPGGGRILIVRTDPDIFRVVHPSVPGGVAVFGPFIDSKLENDGEKIELSKPGDPEPGGFVPYIRIEQVNYSDGTHPVGGDPWPTSADGNGDSLNRVSETDYSNDVNNWTAALPTPGS